MKIWEDLPVSLPVPGRIYMRGAVWVVVYGKRCLWGGVWKEVSERRCMGEGTWEVVYGRWCTGGGAWRKPPSSIQWWQFEDSRYIAIGALLNVGVNQDTAWRNCYRSNCECNLVLQWTSLAVSNGTVRNAKPIFIHKVFERIVRKRHSPFQLRVIRIIKRLTLSGPCL